MSMNPATGKWWQKLLLSGGNPVLFAPSFSALTVGANATPGGLTVVRASVAGVENGPNIFLIDTAAINQGRIGLIGSKQGLRVERATTNLFLTPRDPATWSAAFAGSSTTATSGTDMSGATYAKLCVHNVLLAGYSKFLTMTGLTIGQLYSVSVAAQAGGTTALQHSNYSGSQSILNGVLTSSWARYSKFFTQASLTSLSSCPCDGRDMSASGGEVAQARAYTTDLHQVENSPVSTWISGSRAGEQFKYQASRLASGGRIKPIYTWVPDISAADASTWQAAGILGNFRLWTLDANNYVEIIIGGGNHRKIKVSVAGTSEILGTALPNWAINDTLKIFVSAGNGVSTGWYEQNGGARTSLGTGVTPLDPIVVGGADLDLFCSGTTNQLQGLIQSIQFLA